MRQLDRTHSTASQDVLHISTRLNQTENPFFGSQRDVCLHSAVTLLQQKLMWSEHKIFIVGFLEEVEIGRAV